MNGVIYARFSSENQREESIDGQIRECTAYCEKNGITVVGHYIDRAMSAKTDNRPDFQRMIKDSAKGNFDFVVVWKIDRFARNRYDSAYYKNQLKKNNVKVLSATENIADGPDGILLEALLEGMAEYYSAELAEKVNRGMTENALKCKYNGGVLTFGYMIDAERHYQIDPVNAGIILEIFKMYDEDYTMLEICKHLEAKGLVIRKKVPGINFVQRALSNRRYLGEYIYKDIVIPGGIPQIVPDDLFERVQKKLEINKRAGARHKADDDYLLTTKLFCGDCQSFMVGECGTGKSGGVYHYYRCVNSKRTKTCESKHKSIRKEKIEKVVISHLVDLIMDDDFINNFSQVAYDTQSIESSITTALKNQLAETEKGIENLINAVQMGIFSESTRQRLNDLEETKRKLQESIVQEELGSPVFTLEEIRAFLMSYRKLDFNSLKGKRTLVDRFLNSVVVYDDHILISINYKDKSKRVDFKEIDEAKAGSDTCCHAQPKKKSELYVRISFFDCFGMGFRRKAAESHITSASE